MLQSDERDLVLEISVSDFAQFLTIKQGLRPNSLKQVRLRFSALQKYIRENNLKLDKSSVEKFLYELKQKGLRNTSINSYIFMLSMLEKYYKDRGFSGGFTEGLKQLEKQSVHIEVLSVEEIDRILETDLEYGMYQGKDTSRLNFVYKTLTRFLAMTGCRFNECVSLRIKDIDLSLCRAILRETKNGEHRYVYLSEPLLTHLKQLIGERNKEDLLFTSMTGGKIVDQSYLLDLSNRARKAGINKRVYPHLFRHSFATQMIASGLEISRVALLTGHKDIQVLFERYLHLADEQIRKSMYYHPLFRQGIDPKEILKTIVEQIKGLRVDSDPRFAYSLQETDTGVKIEVEIKS